MNAATVLPPYPEPAPPAIRRYYKSRTKRLVITCTTPVDPNEFEEIEFMDSARLVVCEDYGCNYYG